MSKFILNLIERARSWQPVSRRVGNVPSQSLRGAAGDEESRKVLVCGARSLASLGMTGLLTMAAASGLPAQNSATSLPKTGDQQEYVLSSETLSAPSTREVEAIVPDDQLDIYVLDVPELSRQYRVGLAGTIEVPLLKGPVMAAGLTAEQLAKSIREKLQAAGMVNDPHVTVQVTNSRAHAVTIAGAVKNPQIYPVMSKTTLLDAISQAGGLSVDASDTAIVARGDLSSRILASDNSGNPANADPAPARTIKVDLRRLMEDGDPDLNLTLYPGDRVTVQRAGMVYVVGAVNRAGGFAMANEGEHMTVLKAIALAQNIKSTASTGKACIIRNGRNGGNEQVPVNLKKILDGKQPDLALLANDILFVPDSSSKKAMYRAGEAAAQAASLMIYRVP